MTLDEAIEHNKAIKESGEYLGDPDDSKAVQLGIEALIRERNNRINPGAYRDLLLPGETVDYHHQGLPLKGIVVKTE